MWAWVLAWAWAHVSGCERGRWHARGHMFLDASVGAGMRAGICFSGCERVGMRVDALAAPASEELLRTLSSPWRLLFT